MTDHQYYAFANLVTVCIAQLVEQRYFFSVQFAWWGMNEKHDICFIEAFVCLMGIVCVDTQARGIDKHVVIELQCLIGSGGADVTCLEMLVAGMPA
ncbi:hypothetical protein D3C77_405080 [compost metagenome]